MQAYRVATRKSPHPYPDYYDDFTLLQRLQLVMDLVSRPRVVGHSVRYGACHAARTAVATHRWCQLAGVAVRG